MKRRRLNRNLTYPDSYLNNIICGDSLKLLQNIPDNVIDIVVTSPPYNCGIDYDIYDDNKSWKEYYVWCYKWMKEIYRILKTDGRFCLNHYLSMGKPNNRHTPLMDLNYISVNKIGFKHSALAVWDDRTLSSGTAWGSWLSASAPYIQSPYEGVIILYKNQWKKLDRGTSEISKEDFIEACHGVWKMGVDTKRLTKATFPERLPKLCIDLLSYKEDIVLDPFNGSGTTTYVAKNSGRKFIGIDISPNYSTIARQRIKEV